MCMLLLAYVYEMICVHMYVAHVFVVPALSRGNVPLLAIFRATFYFVGNLYECQCFSEMLIFRFVKFLALIYVPFIGEVMPHFLFCTII